MRKLAVVLAAALIVSVPLAMTVTTDVYAASKKHKRVHHRAAPRVAAPAAPADVGVQPPFAQITRAIGDLGNQLATAGQR
jgi:hypothetical protein